MHSEVILYYTGKTSFYGKCRVQESKLQLSKLNQWTESPSVVNFEYYTGLKFFFTFCLPFKSPEVWHCGVSWWSGVLDGETHDSPVQTVDWFNLKTIRRYSDYTVRTVTVQMGVSLKEKPAQPPVSGALSTLPYCSNDSLHFHSHQTSEWPLMSCIKHLHLS